MNITRAVTLTTKRGSPEYFTGTVWLDEIAANAVPTRVRVVRVTFEPGARTAWHTHPHGQLLHIASGIGLVQKAGESAVEVHPGDTVWFEPGERHWHGASPDRTMVHWAVQQADDAGAAAHWQEHVTDVDYRRGRV